MEWPRLPYYHVTRRIASGGMANVYEGVDLRSGATVAIKEMNADSLKNKSVRENFKKTETEIYLYSDHPNIPKLVDFVELEYSDKVYIVMELIKGINLDTFVYQQYGLLPEQKALPMFLEIADAIAYLHRRNILHLDIKMNNIMLQKDGRIKVIDMGVASRMGDVSMAGTYGYMPPEQILHKPCTRSTDVFALGVVLYEMLTAHRPFVVQGVKNDKEQYIKEMLRLIYDGAPPMQDFYPAIHPDLQAIVERAIYPDAAYRYQSCGDFMRTIEDYKHRHKIYRYENSNRR